MRRTSLWSRSLVALQATLGLSAVYGGVGLALQLDGFEMPTRWLDPLPLESWVLPGLALVVVVAAPMVLAALAGWRHDRRTGPLAWAAVLLLLAWLGVQLLVVGLRAPIQVVTLVLAAVLLLLTRMTTREGS